MLFVPAVLLALILYLSYANEFFATELNVTNIFLQAATLAIVAFGLSFVIFAGELDLSVGRGRRAGERRRVRPSCGTAARSRSASSPASGSARGSG